MAWADELILSLESMQRWLWENGRGSEAPSSEVLATTNEILGRCKVNQLLLPSPSVGCGNAAIYISWEINDRSVRFSFTATEIFVELDGHFATAVNEDQLISILETLCQSAEPT